MRLSTTKIKSFWFGTIEVMGYPVWLATVMHNSCYGNDYYYFLENVSLWG